MINYTLVIKTTNAFSLVLKYMEKVQNIGCKVVIKTFKSVSLALVELETTFAFFKSPLNSDSCSINH